MTEERYTDDSTAGDAGTPGDAAAPSPYSTVEEAEAFFRNRQSGIDRAHNAEVAAFKAQLDALRTAPAPAPAGETPEAARVRELEQALQKSEQARQAATLQVQYPTVASVLGESVAALPPEKLVALETFLGDRGVNGGLPIIDPNAAPRQRSAVQTPQAKPDSEKTKDELLADLRRIAPGYQQARREGLI